MNKVNMHKDSMINYSSVIMNLIADNELSVFDIDDFVRLKGLSYVELKPILRRLVRDGQIFRLEKGLYCVRNFRNPYVIANILQKESAIAYWSALNLHRLTEQIPNVVYVQSSRQKTAKTVFGVRYKFIQVKPEKMCGVTQMGYGSESFRITEVEKTLLDCFDLPQYSGGYEELIRAFYQAKISTTRLFNYGRQMNNLSILKRMAFLSELYEMKGFTTFQTKVYELVNEKYSLLDPSGDETGEFNSKWRIRVNIPREKLLGIIHKMY